MTQTFTDPLVAAQHVANSPGLTRNERHQYFYGDTGPLPSVTNIIKVLDRSGPLIGWAKRETAASAVRNLDMLRGMIDTGGKEAAQKWLAQIPDYQRDTAADLGARVHGMADELARGGTPVPDPQAMPYVQAYLKFLRHTNPRVIHSEALVANLTHGYGGTLDLSAELFGDGVPGLFDIKTGSGVYAETALQLVGYDRAEFTATATDPTQVALPQHRRYGVIHLHDDWSWTLIPYEVGDNEWEAFLACRRLLDWTKDSAPWVKGQPYEGGAA